MFRVETEGRFIKIQPTSSATWRVESGWLVMESVSAKNLADQITYLRAQSENDSEPEDG